MSPDHKRNLPVPGQGAMSYPGIGKAEELLARTDHETIRIVSEQFGPAIAYLLRETYTGSQANYIAGNEEMRTAIANIDPNMAVVESKWSETRNGAVSMGRGRTSANSVDLIPGISVLGMIGSNLQFLYGLEESGRKLTALLLGTTRIDLATAYEKAFSDMLVNGVDYTKIRGNPGDGFVGAMVRQWRAFIPHPVHEIAETIGGMGIDGSETEATIAKMMLAQTAVAAAGVIIGRQAYNQCVTEARRSIGGDLNKSSGAAQVIGGKLGGIEQSLSLQQAKREAAEQALGALVYQAGRGAEKAEAAKELGDSAQQVLRLHSQYILANNAMFATISALKGTNARVDATVATLDTMGRNIQSMIELALIGLLTYGEIMGVIQAAKARVHQELKTQKRLAVAASYREMLTGSSSRVMEKVYEATGGPYPADGALGEARRIISGGGDITQPHQAVISPKNQQPRGPGLLLTSPRGKQD